MFVSAPQAASAAHSGSSYAGWSGSTTYSTTNRYGRVPLLIARIIARVVPQAVLDTPCPRRGPRAAPQAAPRIRGDGCMKSTRGNF